MSSMRKVFGYKNFEHFCIAFYYQLGELPETKSTHRFCGCAVFDANSCHANNDP